MHARPQSKTEREREDLFVPFAFPSTSDDIGERDDDDI